MPFELHPNLHKKSFIQDLPLCRVLLEDNQYYPWIFLVPRRANIGRLMELEMTDQLQLLKELDFSQKTIWDAFELTQLNVAAIGNKTPQLHVHVIGRRESDPAWPNTVWDYPAHQPYLPTQKDVVIQMLTEKFSTYQVE
jgi:diadenosine tetraphosphate (Ap4A) HIT family hydrolase